MARGDHWWSEPPRWAWVAMVAGLMAIIVMLPIALTRTAPVSEAANGALIDTGDVPRPSGTSAAASETTEAPPDDADTARVLAIGDSDTGGSPQGEQRETAWPALLEQRTPGTDIEVVATGDAGYVTTEGEPTLRDLVLGADLTDVDLVVLFGSRFDAAGISDQVGAAAEEAFSSVRERAPDATLVVIGPAWISSAAPAGVRNNRDVIKAAAENGLFPFVDPLGEAWLADATGLVGVDGIHLTDEGHARLADQIVPIVEEALEARAAKPTASEN